MISDLCGHNNYEITRRTKGTNILEAFVGKIRDNTFGHVFTKQISDF